MEKEQPPPYSAATNETHPSPGFAAPTAQPPQQHPPPQAGYHVGAQPGYPQPGYPQPGYPQSGYPQPGYSQPTAPTTTVVVSVPGSYGPHPQPLTCSHCHAQITTRVIGEPGMRTHLVALVLCLVGCVPCCVIPYFMDSCLSQNHYCPSCNAFLGTYNNGMGTGW